MSTCFIGIGSNLGNRRENIKWAIALLKNAEGIKVRKISRFYETEPVGGPPQGRFLNGAVKIETDLSPLKLLKVLKDAEKRLGRKKTSMRNLPRPIDLDLLLYGNKRIKTRALEVPHPRMKKREFVLKPLAELI